MKIGATQKSALKWMAINPFYCSNNTAMSIARKVAEECGAGEMTIYQGIRRLVKQNVVNEEIDYKGFTKGLSINWNCHSLPKEIMEYAPKSVQEAVEETNEKLKSGEYLGVDPFGAGITKEAEPNIREELAELKWHDTNIEGVEVATQVNEVKHDVAEFTEKLIESGYDKTLKKLGEESETKSEAKPESAQTQEPVTTENAVSVEPMVVKTADGKSISISLTINLNL